MVPKGCSAPFSSFKDPPGPSQRPLGPLHLTDICFSPSKVGDISSVHSFMHTPSLKCLGSGPGPVVPHHRLSQQPQAPMMGYFKGAQSHGHPDIGEVRSHQKDREGFMDVVMSWVLKDG